MQLVLVINRFMKSQTIITDIKRLLRKCGGYQDVAKKIGVTARYVRHLEKGEKIPSDHLRKLIKLVVR